ncbi:hypothetical protein PM082_004296 [Marasmius tenuissimus]|nr:hypothetical protein PM082_004296 [Marasmius tenuissimus]
MNLESARDGENEKMNNKAVVLHYTLSSLSYTNIYQSSSSSFSIRIYSNSRDFALLIRSNRLSISTCSSTIPSDGRRSVSEWDEAWLGGGMYVGEKCWKEIMPI